MLTDADSKETITYYRELFVSMHFLAILITSVKRGIAFEQINIQVLTIVTTIMQKNE